MQGSKRDTDIKNRLLKYVGEGKGRMIWENGIETYIISCETDSQFRFEAWNRVLRTWGLDSRMAAQTPYKVAKTWVGL